MSRLAPLVPRSSPATRRRSGGPPETLRAPQPDARRTAARPDRAGGGRRAPDWSPLLELRPAVLAFLRRRCRDEHQAEDLTQETLLRAARHLDHLHRVQRPTSWALQIAANVHLDHARKESWQTLAPPDHAAFLAIPGSEPVPGEGGGPQLYRVGEREVDGDDLSEAVRQVWGRLLERDRVVLASFYLEGGGTRAAASACGVTRDLVKVRLFRARRRLHAAVLEHLEAR